MMSIGQGLKPAPGVRIDRIVDPVRRRVAKDLHDQHVEYLRAEWEKHGAAFGLVKGLSVVPDPLANRSVEGALKALAQRLSGLVLPEKVAESEDWNHVKTALALAMPGLVPLTYRGNAPATSPKGDATKPSTLKTRKESEAELGVAKHQSLIVARKPRASTQPTRPRAAQPDVS
jgi:hypothetical protein